MRLQADGPVTRRLVRGAVVLAWLGLSAAPAPGLGVSPDERAPGPVVSGVVAPVPSPSLLVQFARLQRRLTETLSRQVRRVRRGETGAVVTLLLLSLAYGVLHAVGPGHGKAVIASVFLGRDARVTRGIGIGFLISLLQVLTSIVAVAVLALIFRHSSLAVSAEAVWVEVVSYALVALLGLSMTWAAVRRSAPHAHGTGAPDGGRTLPGLVLAAGLTPCPSGIIVLLFALANGILGVGIEACLVMAAGMGVTVSAIGVATILARRAVLRPLRARPRAVRWVSVGLAVAGSLTLTVMGGLLCVNAWARLP